MDERVGFVVTAAVVLLAAGALGGALGTAVREGSGLGDALPTTSPGGPVTGVPGTPGPGPSPSPSGTGAAGDDDAGDDDTEDPDAEDPDAEDPDGDVGGGTGVVSLSAGAEAVDVYERVTLSGRLGSGESGVVLQVQRLEGGRWVDFPVTFRSGAGGEFAVEVASGRKGENVFRVTRRDGGVLSGGGVVASDGVSVQVGEV